MFSTFTRAPEVRRGEFGAVFFRSPTSLPAPFRVHQDFPPPDMVGAADKAALFYPLDQLCGGVIPNPHLPLKPACRGLVALGDDLPGVRYCWSSAESSPVRAPSSAKLSSGSPVTELKLSGNP